MHYHQNGFSGDARDRRYVPHEIEIQVWIESRGHCVRRIDQKEHIAVRRGMRDCFGADIAATARSVFYLDRLPEPFRKMLTYEARKDIGRASRCICDDK